VLTHPELVIAVAVSLLPVVQLGRMHADEVYQWLEPAFARAHGFSDLGWEWQVGIRNWAVPLLFSWLLRLGMAIGLDHPVAARALLAIPHVLLTWLMLGAVRRWVGRRLDSDRALVAVWLLGTYGLFILFAGRSMAETYSAAALVLAVENVDSRKAFAAGVWMGLAIVFRYPSMVIVAGIALGLVIWQRDLFWRALLGGAIVVALLGALDWVTWGRPYHSLIAYLEFNVFSTKGVDAFGAYPISHLLPYVWRIAPWILAGAFWSLRKHLDGKAVILPVALYVAALLVTPHKEGRFLYPAILLLALVALPGWLALIDSVMRPRWRAGLLVGSFLISPSSYFLFQKSLRGDLFWAVVRAGQQADVTGLLVVGEDRWGVGGYFFIGKKIPYDVCPDAVTCGPLLAQRQFNYVVVRRQDMDELAKGYGFRLYHDGKTRTLRRAQGDAR
jgi:phosphatidylinositol glycan class B